MNPANVQIHGLLVLMAEIGRRLVETQRVQPSEVELVLKRAEASIRRDEMRMEQLSASQIEAMLFPLRYLAQTLGPDAPQRFSQVTQAVGRSDTADRA
jgi:hypothetical protein